MDLNQALMSEQISLYRARQSRCLDGRSAHRADARAVRRDINARFAARSPFPPVAA